MKILVVVVLAALLGCEPPPTVGPSDEWTLVDKTPNGSGIYRKRCEKEGVTFYATQLNGYWSVAAVKDLNEK